MFRSIKIQNFKGFNDFSLTELKFFNLIIGKNNIGKSALLEALFLHIGARNPELPSKIGVFRGLHPIPPNVESLWSPLFYNFNESTPITISSKDDKNVIRVLSIKLGSKKSTTILSSKEKVKSNLASLATTTTDKDRLELSFHYGEKKQQHVSLAIMENDDIKIENSRASDFQGMLLFSSSKGGGREDVERYSLLDKEGKTGDIIQILRKIEPKLRRLIPVIQGVNVNLYGDLGYNRPIPIQLMGEGVQKLLTIVLAIAIMKDGFVLIDEIENGFHYSILNEIFSAVKEFAKKYNVQLFATTHSNECVQASYKAFANTDADDFIVIRLDKEDSKIKPVIYDKELLKSVIENGWEIRG